MSSAIKTQNGLVVYTNGQTFPVNDTHPNYKQIKDAVRRKAWRSLPELINVSLTIQAIVNGKLDDVRVEKGNIIYQGIPFPTSVSEKVIAMRDEGFDIEPLIRFLKKVRENPSFTAQEELFLFCIANGFPIHEDGDIVAYKGVESNYMDCHTKSVLNKLAIDLTADERASLPRTTGKVTVSIAVSGNTAVSMPRFAVDDNRNETCSTGLHFAAYEYVRGSYGGSRKMVVKINPRDIVSIPSDYNNQKGRCCLYEVIAELGKAVEQKESIQPMPPQEVFTTRDITRASEGLDTKGSVYQWVRQAILKVVHMPEHRLTDAQWFADEDALLVIVEAREKYKLPDDSMEYEGDGLTLRELVAVIQKAVGV